MNGSNLQFLKKRLFLAAFGFTFPIAFWVAFLITSLFELSTVWDLSTADKLLFVICFPISYLEHSHTTILINAVFAIFLHRRDIRSPLHVCDFSMNVSVCHDASKFVVILQTLHTRQYGYLLYIQFALHLIKSEATQYTWRTYGWLMYVESIYRDERGVIRHTQLLQLQHTGFRSVTGEKWIDRTCEW